MKNFKEYLDKKINEDASLNPNSDVDRYITGLHNRLALLNQEETHSRKEKLIDLIKLINFKLSGG